MLSRGYYIGEIVDEFAVLAAQVKMRNTLHLFDLTVTTEYFFRDVLNALLDVELQNLNSERSNEPGLDLGDKASKIGVQVTSSATSDKVTHTLKKITADQAASYTKIIVLGLSKRQRTYSIDEALEKKYSFDKRDIWDLDTLARKAFDLPLDRLQRLYNLVRENSARLKIELEVPDENGKYPTSSYEMWEDRSKPKIGSGETFCSYVEELTDNRLDGAEVVKSLSDLGAKLSRLPRMTREFLAMLFERREEGDSRRFKDGWAHLLLSKVEREYRGQDLKGELDILAHSGFISIDGEDPYEYGPTEIGVRVPSESEDLALMFIEFVVANGLSFRSVIGSVNLSNF